MRSTAHRIFCISLRKTVLYTISPTTFTNANEWGNVHLWAWPPLTPLLTKIQRTVRYWCFTPGRQAGLSPGDQSSGLQIMSRWLQAWKPDPFSSAWNIFPTPTLTDYSTMRQEKLPAHRCWPDLLECWYNCGHTLAPRGGKEHDYLLNLIVCIYILK